MKAFAKSAIREAVAYAAAGGQALHVWCATAETIRGCFGQAPACFKRGGRLAHLFDQDMDRLCGTVRRLGVRRVVVSREGHPYQHIDLCGAPLRRALAEAEQQNGGGQ